MNTRTSTESLVLSSVKASPIKGEDGAHKSIKSDTYHTSNPSVNSSIIKGGGFQRKTMSLYGSTYEASHEKKSFQPVKDQGVRSNMMGSGGEISEQQSFIREKYSQNILSPEERAKLLGAKSPRELYAMYKEESRNNVLRLKADIQKSNGRKAESESAHHSRLKNWLSRVPWESSTSVTKIDEEDRLEEKSKGKKISSSPDLANAKPHTHVDPAFQISRTLFKSTVNIYSPIHNWKEGTIESFSGVQGKKVRKPLKSKS
jgi:hypothetical protein